MLFLIALLAGPPQMPSVATPSAASLSAAAPPALAPPAVTLWAGAQEVTGSRNIPLLGAVKTRNLSWFIAERRATKDGFELVQRPCGVRFDSVMGVQVHISGEAVQSVPPATLRFTTEPDGSFGARAATSGWDASDHDGDGKPGITVGVKAAVCGGSLQVASQASTSARLRAVGAGLEGVVKVHVKQQILAAEGACLKRAAQDSDETLTGWVRLVPAPGTATCQTWSAARWPALKRSTPR
ncbi:MAG: hypothetical protein ACI9U2_002021 [Bradymonadia bacterium]|jgi:hypothetical protein